MKLREFFTSESKWCKGASAKSESGKDTGPIDTDAARWCLLGGSENVTRSVIERKSAPASTLPLAGIGARGMINKKSRSQT
jgi:hypothetical protein